MDDTSILKNQIEITQVDNPHKFWYKRCNDPIQERLIQKLENCIAKDVQDLLECENQMPTIKMGDVVAVYHPKWKKWIRAKAGKIERCETNKIHIWAIDYGCSMILELAKVVPLQNQTLAAQHPINVNIGGLAGISPAETVSVPIFIFINYGKFVRNCSFFPENSNSIAHIFLSEFSGIQF